MRPTFVVGGDEPKDVVMSEHDRLVDLALARPRPLVSAAEDLDGHVLAAPVAQPHFTEAEEHKQVSRLISPWVNEDGKWTTE